MCLLIETIRILNGQPENLEWHTKRFNSSRADLFGIKKSEDLGNTIIVPSAFSKGEFKCRIVYGKNIESIEFEPYVFRPVNSLKLVFDDKILYDFKYKDRGCINKLFEIRKNSDDILIFKNGFLSDSSYCNVVLSDGINFHTPSTPLLKGTKRAKYLAEGKISERNIQPDELKHYKELHLINAFLDLGRCAIPTQNISH